MEERCHVSLKLQILTIVFGWRRNTIGLQKKAKEGIIEVLFDPLTLSRTQHSHEISLMADCAEISIH